MSVVAYLVAQGADVMAKDDVSDAKAVSLMGNVSEPPPHEWLGQDADVDKVVTAGRGSSLLVVFVFARHCRLARHPSIWLL